MKKLGFGLALIGAFLFVVGLMAQTFAIDRLMKTPLDVDSTTKLEGTAQLSNGTELESFPVKAWSITHADSNKSDDDVVVFQNSSCLVKDEGGIEECVSADDPGDRLLSASIDNFATDRRNAEAVNESKYLPADAEVKEGLVNKWPFLAEKKTYSYWDGTAGAAYDAVFDREETLEGLNTYVYRIEVDEAPIEIAAGVLGYYSTVKEIYIDPVTGSFIHQTDDQQRVDEEGEPVLLLDLAFTDTQIAENVKDAQANGDRLNIVRTLLPRIGYFVGLPLLLIGLVLRLRRSGGAHRGPAADAEEAKPKVSS